MVAGSLGVQLWVKSSSEAGRSLINQRQATSETGSLDKISKSTKEKSDGQCRGEIAGVPSY